LSGGFLRKDSPWAYQNVQNLISDTREKGLAGKKEFKQYIAEVRRTADSPTPDNIKRLMNRTKKEERSLGRTTIDGILSRRRGSSKRR